MKIVSWNCNGALRKKIDFLDQEYNGDIYLIQECEVPRKFKDCYSEKWTNCVWHGQNQNKGLAILAKDGIDIKELHWPDNGFMYYLPVEINGSFQLLNTWCHGGDERKYRYIGQLWNYIQINKHRFADIIIGGDLNSNTIWDKKHGHWSHSHVVGELSEFVGEFSLSVGEGVLGKFGGIFILLR